MRSLHGVIFNNHFQNFRHAANFTCDAGSCSAGLDAPGRSGSYTPGIYIWNNTYTNVVPDTDGMYWIEPGCCAGVYTRYDYEVFGYNDGIGSDHGVPKPGYTPYTYPHPLTLEDIPLKGDVNSDKAVNILDVQALVNHILGIQDYCSSADVNSDVSVDVLDVQEVVNIILG